MSDPGADTKKSEKYTRKLQTQESYKDEKRKRKMLKTANKEEQFDFAKKKIIFSEDSFHFQDEYKNQQKELNIEEQTEEENIFVASPEETSSKMNPEVTSQNETVKATLVLKKTTGAVGVFEKAKDTSLEEEESGLVSESLDQKSNESSVIQKTMKSHANENNEVKIIMKMGDKNEETKQLQGDDGSAGEKKIFKKTDLDDGGMKLSPKVPTGIIAPGAVRNLGTGPFKSSSVPLLLGMPGGGGGGGSGLSLLSAGLPPGRYLILPSTTSTVPSISTIRPTTSPVGIKTTPITPMTQQSPKVVSVASLTTVTTTTSAIASAPSVLAPSTATGRVVRPVARGTYCSGRSVRGRRRSYTAAEKLAMIEAVEAGQKKSNVADLFGVAPSTLACILLQKNKIRSDQMKVDLSRRRLRHARQTPIVPAPEARPSGTGESENGNENPFVHFLSALSPPRPPVLEEYPEEIVSMPDLSADRMGMEESSTAVKGEGAPNYLTCSPVLATGPGLQEDHPSADPAPGPSSSSQETAEEKAPFTELDQEDLKPEETYTQPSEICEDENSQNIPQSTADRPPSRSSPASGMAGPYLLKKETHCATILDQLLRDDTFSDVILTAEGQSIRAHKIVLCLASAYFRRVLNKESSIQNVIVFRDIKFSELRNIINFIYTGEATVDAADLESFMRTAEMLEVNSLCEGQRNFPQNLFPRSKEVESEKPRISNVCSKRSHNNLSTSPPTKSRKIAAETPSMKLPRSSPCPSTSADNTAPSIRVSTSVIKSEPPDDEMTVEPEFRGKDYADAYVNPVDSPSNYEEPGESPPIRNEKPEKNPSSMCPFCLISPRAGTSLTNHVHLCHPDKPVFPCDNCSRVFFTKGSLEAHKDDCIR